MRQSCNSCDAIDYSGELNEAGNCSECVPSETPQTDDCERGVHTFIAAVIDGESRYCSNCETEEDEDLPKRPASFMSQALEDELCAAGIHAMVDRFDGPGQVCANCDPVYGTRTEDAYVVPCERCGLNLAYESNRYMHGLTPNNPCTAPLDLFGFVAFGR